MALDLPPPDTLSATFAALADPTRRAILARLSGGESSVGDLTKPFAMSGPAATKHLKVLQRAGLVSQSRQHWEDQLNRLEDSLQTLQQTPLATPVLTAPKP